MPTTARDQLDATAASLTDLAAKLAKILKEQAALRSELQLAAANADTAGLGDFAEVFRAMATQLGPITNNDNKTSGSSKRRGRPPKPADDQTLTE